MPTELASSLKEAVHDLLYMSESDAPFEVVRWNNGAAPLEAKELLTLLGLNEQTPVRECSLEDFFKRLIVEKKWYKEEQKQRTKRYQSLFVLLKQRLPHIKVFFVGTVNVEIYLIGKTAEGEWLGLHTQAVET